jgi:hypothetical protein
MKKLKSSKEIQKEIQKCKDDIVYFVETYVKPEIVLTNFQKELLRAHSRGEKIVFSHGRNCGIVFIAESATRHDDFKKDQPS